MKTTKQSHPTTELLRLFLIDLFGAIIPGFLYIVVIAISFVIPLLLTPLFFGVCQEDSIQHIIINIGNIDLRGGIWWLVLVALIFVSYFIGSIFLRQEPNIPDQSSIDHYVRHKIFYRRPFHEITTNEKIIKENFYKFLSKIDKHFPKTENETYKILKKVYQTKDDNSNDPLKLLINLFIVVFPEEALCIAKQNIKTSSNNNENISENKYYFFGRLLLRIWKLIFPTLNSQEAIRTEDLKQKTNGNLSTTNSDDTYSQAYNYYRANIKYNDLSVTSYCEIHSIIYKDFLTIKSNKEVYLEHFDNVYKSPFSIYSHTNFLFRYCIFTRNRKKREKLITADNRLINRKSQRDPISPIEILYTIFSLQTKFGVGGQGDCIFPYINMYKYLINREDTTILSNFNWNEIDICSRNIINGFKNDVIVYSPEFFERVNKNEADVRMQSSSWYGAKSIINSLLNLIFWCEIPLLLLIFIYLFVHNGCDIKMFCDIKNINCPNNIYMCIVYTFLTILFQFLLVVLTSMVGSQISKPIHDQRLRELCSILHIYNNFTRKRMSGYCTDK